MFRFLAKRNFGSSSTRFLNDPILEKLGIRNKNILRNLRFYSFIKHISSPYIFSAFQSFTKTVVTEVSPQTQTPVPR